MSKIQDTIELFKSYGLIEWASYRYIWTKKAQDIAEKNEYCIASNFTMVGHEPEDIWLQVSDNEFGFRWVEEDDTQFDEYVKMTLKVFNIEQEDNSIPVELEDIIL